jgi:hypothetical protein
MLLYLTRSYADTKLWECFREDFEDWTIDTWKLGDKDVVRDLRDFLRRYGVLVKNGGRIIDHLQDIIDNEKEPI